MTTQDAQPVVAALGVFDGVHLGHQLLLDRVSRGAEREGALRGVVTFDPPPAIVLSSKPLGAIEITPWPEKRDILAALGVERLLLLRFTREFARLSAEGFLKDVLLAELPLAGVVVGHDFTFGAGRRGDPALLERYGRDHGFWVEVISPVVREGARVSSTRIRTFLRAGRVREAAALMGRPLAFEGLVGPGQGVGSRELVPTANLEISAAQLLPAPGVYRVWADLPGGDRRRAVANVGPVPTLGTGHARLVEVHILDYRGDLRDQTLRVGFLDWIREERTFPDLASLREAIEEDIRGARAQFEINGDKPLAPSDPIC